MTATMDIQKLDEFKKLNQRIEQLERGYRELRKIIAGADEEVKTDVGRIFLDELNREIDLRMGGTDDSPDAGPKAA